MQHADSILIIDRSWSMGTKIEERTTRLEAAIDCNKEFVIRFLSGGAGRRVGIVTFASDATVECLLLGRERQSDILAALSGIMAGGVTEMQVGLQAASALFVAHPSSAPQISRSIVLLTDGHNTGDVSPLQLATHMKEYGVTISTVGVASKRDDVDEALLKEMASTVNGIPRYRFIGDEPRALVEHFRQLSRSLVTKE